MMEPNSPEPAYSRAFENFVVSNDDLRGLLSYALYKARINERRKSGIAADEPERRNPLPGEIVLYRQLAESFLETFAEYAINEERASIIERGVAGAAKDIQDHTDRELRNWSDDIKATIIRSTSFWPSVVTGIVAWILSLAITLLVVGTAPPWALNWLPHPS